jgi:hypothetical protein
MHDIDIRIPLGVVGGGEEEKVLESLVTSSYDKE